VCARYPECLLSLQQQKFLDKHESMRSSSGVSEWFVNAKYKSTEILNSSSRCKSYSGLHYFVCCQ